MVNNQKLKANYYIAIIMLIIMKSSGLDNIEYIYKIVGVGAILLMIFKMIGDKYYSIECKKIFMILCLGGVITIFSKKTTILISIIFIICAKKININQLLKMIFFTKIWCFIITILLSLGGVLKNDILFRVLENGEVVKRYSLGFSHPNVTFLNFLVIVLLYLYCYPKKNMLVEFTGIEILSFIMYRITDSRTGFIVIQLALVLQILKKYRTFECKILKRIFVFMPILCSVLSIGSSIVYDKNIKILEIINKILSGRIELGNRFLEIYDIKLFGQKILEGSDLNGSYLRIDNGYIALLLGYGIIIFILYMVLEYKLLKKYVIEEKYDEIILIVIFLIYGLTEVYIYNILINISLLFLRDLLFTRKEYECRRIYEEERDFMEIQ